LQTAPDLVAGWQLRRNSTKGIPLSRRVLSKTRRRPHSLLKEY
jgi:hypothetical protein